AALRAHVTHGDELVVGLDDGEPADPVLLGECPDGGKLRAGPQLPAFDPAAQLVHDLIEQRTPVLAVQREDLHGDPSLKSMGTGPLAVPVQLRDPAGALYLSDMKSVH